MRVLLVCLERPLVEETPNSARVRSRRPETFSVKERWAYNDLELSRLLNMLVAWRRGGPHRIVQILSGGLRVGVETIITQRGKLKCGWQKRCCSKEYSSRIVPDVWQNAS